MVSSPPLPPAVTLSLPSPPLIRSLRLVVLMVSSPVPPLRVGEPLPENAVKTRLSFPAPPSICTLNSAKRMMSLPSPPSTAASWSWLAMMESSPAPPSRLSMPGPPFSVSLPMPPSRVSSPSWPSRLSSPLSPSRLSSPPLPSSVSFSSPPIRVSFSPTLASPSSPIRESGPRPPIMLSAPGPPVTRSRSGPASMVSPPRLPTITSFPARPLIMSASSVPDRLSSPLVPVKVWVAVPCVTVSILMKVSVTDVPPPFTKVAVPAAPSMVIGKAIPDRSRTSLPVPPFTVRSVVPGRMVWLPPSNTTGAAKPSGSRAVRPERSTVVPPVTRISVAPSMRDSASICAAVTMTVRLPDPVIKMFSMSIKVAWVRSSVSLVKLARISSVSAPPS